MRKFNFKQSLGLMAAAMLVSSAAFAADFDVANGKKIFTTGKGDEVQPCQTCHGTDDPTGKGAENAHGNDSLGAPRLAGIGYGYVVKQLTDFASDRRVPQGAGAVMPIFAKALTEQERRDVAAYVNSIKAAPELSDLKKLKADGQTVGDTYKGAQIVRAGQGSISACTSCHDYNGRGVDPMFPRIGQQKYVYLVNQLTNWRAGANKQTPDDGQHYARTNDPSGMMRAVAKTLTDDDIHNLAAYLSSAPPTRGSGDEQPDNNTMMHAADKK